MPAEPPTNEPKVPEYVIGAVTVGVDVEIVVTEPLSLTTTREPNVQGVEEERPEPPTTVRSPEPRIELPLIVLKSVPETATDRGFVEPLPTKTPVRAVIARLVVVAEPLFVKVLKLAVFVNACVPAHVLDVVVPKAIDIAGVLPPDEMIGYVPVTEVTADVRNPASLLNHDSFTDDEAIELNNPLEPIKAKPCERLGWKVLPLKVEEAVEKKPPRKPSMVDVEAP